MVELSQSSVQTEASGRSNYNQNTGRLGAIHCITFTCDCKHFATGSSKKDSSSIWIWDNSKYPPVIESSLDGHEDSVTCLSFSKDGLLVSGSKDASVMIWYPSKSSTSIRCLRDNASTVTSVSFSPDNHIVAAGFDDGALLVWNWDNETVLCRHDLRPSDPPMSLKTSLTFSHDGKYLAASYDRSIYIFLWTNGSQLDLIADSGHMYLPHSLKWLSFSETSSETLLSSHQEAVKLWSLRDGKLTETNTSITPRKGLGSIFCAILSSNGKVIITGGERTIRFWNAEKGIEIGKMLFASSIPALVTFRANINEVTSLSISPNGTQIIVALGDSSIHIWKLKEGFTHCLTAESPTDEMWNASFKLRNGVLADKTHSTVLHPIIETTSTTSTSSVDSDNSFEEFYESNSLRRYGNAAPDLSAFLDKGATLGNGGFGEVFKGSWKYNVRGKQPQSVVIKSIREDRRGETKSLRALFRELSLLHKLKHPNIVQFVGVWFEKGQLDAIPSMVCVCMEGGTLIEYIQKNVNTRIRPLLLDVASGLKYLHTHPEGSIIHGDIKSSNLLVSSKGRVCLSDFGISRLVSNSTTWMTTAKEASGSLPFMAPELLTADAPTVTKSTDIYAFSITIIEVITRKMPFEDILVNTPFASGRLTLHVMNGHRPGRPSEISSDEFDDLWTLLSECWSGNPDERPKMEGEFGVAERLDSVLPLTF